MFGRDTIRKFDSNVSEMKQMAARNFEDILQVRFCALPLALFMTHTHLISALSLHLTGSSQSRTTQMS